MPAVYYIIVMFIYAGGHMQSRVQTLIKRRSRVIYWAPIRFKIIYEFLEARGPVLYIYIYIVHTY